MDLPSSLKKSFKYRKHSTKISAGHTDHEEQPMLSELRHRTMNADASDSQGRPEVIVKIDGGLSPSSAAPGRLWRGPSYEFWKEGDRGGEGFNFEQRAEAGDDPPTKLIGQFLDRQKAAGCDVSLDMDLDMDELRPEDSRALPPIAETRVLSSNKRKVDVDKIQGEESSDDDDDDVPPPAYHNRRRSSNLPTAAAAGDNSGGGEVLKSPSFQRRQSILRTKTRSRLIDPPEQPDWKAERVGKSGTLKSGLLGKASGMLGKPPDDEEDDPLFDEDIPEEFKKTNLTAVTLIQWFSLVMIVTALICTLSISKLKGRMLWELELWKWEVLILVLICGRLVSGWGIRLVVFFVERNFLLRKRVLYFVYGVRKAVQNCIWLGLVLIAWHSMFDSKVERETKILRYLNDILLCLLAGTLLWLVKTLMVKVLASSFHVSTFFDRIQESLFNQYVIETLSGPPLIDMHNSLEEEGTMAEIQILHNAGAAVPPDLRESAFLPMKNGRVIGSGRLQRAGRVISFPSKKDEEGISIDHLHKLNPKNISAWNMKRLMKIVRHGVLSTLDEQILDSTQHDESTTQIRSEFEAKVAARKIFRNVARPGSKFIYREDLMHFMQEDEALKTMNLLGESSDSEKISKSALKNWVVNAFNERRALALTLNDTKTAVNKLHQMVNIVVIVIIVIISLEILGIATSKFLVFLSSQIVVAAFVFGNTCKTIFESIIFLFVMHPFDVGDRCEIEDVQMIVEEMNILTTVFLRFDNQKIIYPNSTLSTQPISNYYRSPDMGDAVEFCVHIATPSEKIAIMKQRITSYVDGKKDHWYPSPTIVMMNLEDLTKVKLAVWIRHKMNHQNMGERWARRALLVEEMVKIFKELDIEYRLLPFDINVRTMPPINFTRLPSTWTAPPDS